MHTIQESQRDAVDNHILLHPPQHFRSKQLHEILYPFTGTLDTWMRDKSLCSPFFLSFYLFLSVYIRSHSFSRKWDLYRFFREFFFYIFSILTQCLTAFACVQLFLL